MNYTECNFEDLKSCAALYELSMKTAQAWAGKSVEPVPWSDPARVLEWYRVAFGREPGKRVRDRVSILGPQYVAARGNDDDPQVAAHFGSAEKMPAPEVAGAGQTPCGDLREMMERVLGALGSEGTVANIAREELEAYEIYKERKNADLDCSVQFSNWKDLTKTKREWMKTPDAVDVALKALKFWARGEWELQWKTLRTALDGRRLGMAARDALMATGDNPLEWRRVWDMEMEAVISELLGAEK